ncbi:uncharacterized protein LOC135949206 [Calliphora vicina]|uniref:uncharacterized protein LOC135949206 n=1 Tax=Calliphora vicina TaxID=7373 RepID=UPI00325AD434
MFFKRFIILVLLIPTFTLARKIKRKGHYVLTHPHQHQPLPPPTTTAPDHPYHFEEVNGDEFSPQPQNYGHERYGQQDSFEPHDHYGQHTILSGTYLIDNGLRSIAKGSADQANSAVASQNAAGKQAAYVAKNSLAQAATQAAGTAVAVLKGKEVFLQRLDEQTAEAHRAMQGELQQLQQAKRSAKAAQYAAQQALNHVSILTAALNNAQSASELSQKAASEAAAELASQIDMVAQAKTKLEQIETQLYTTRLDYEETKDAAEKATLSAQEAQLNANDAAQHANVELQSESHGSGPAETIHVHLPDTHDHDHEVHSIVKRRFKNNEKVKKP